MIAHHEPCQSLGGTFVARPDGIETARLRLRLPRMEDAQAIADVLSEQETARMLPSLPFPYDRQDALEWLLPRASGVLPGWTHAVTMRGDDRLIGAVSIERANDRWVLGYWMSPSARGKGLATEAVRAAVTVFFAALPQERLQASVLVDNPASFVIQAGLGFRITGCRDIFCPARGAMKNMLETVLDRNDIQRV